MRALHAAVIALAAIVSPATAAAAWPEVPLPADSSAEWVSRHMVYNGLDMRARRFRSGSTPEQAIAFYREAWGERMVQDQVGRKTVLGHLADGHYVTVEIEPAGGATRGTVGIMRIPDGPLREPPGHGFARPAGSEVVNDIRYLDTPSPVRTLVLTNRHSPYVNQQFYRQRLAAQGWTPRPGACAAASSACVADFEKPGGARMRMSIRRDGDARTVVVANLE